MHYNCLLKYNKKCALSASYEHEGYSKYSYNIITQFNEPFLVMNNSFDDNPLYYGDAFVTGFSSISYDSINDLSFNTVLHFLLGVFQLSPYLNFKKFSGLLGIQ